MKLQVLLRTIRAYWSKRRVVPPVLFRTNYYSIEILHGVTAIILNYHPHHAKLQVLPKLQVSFMIYSLRVEMNIYATKYQYCTFSLILFVHSVNNKLLFVSHNTILHVILLSTVCNKLFQATTARVCASRAAILNTMCWSQRWPGWYWSTLNKHWWPQLRFHKLACCILPTNMMYVCFERFIDQSLNQYSWTNCRCFVSSIQSSRESSSSLHKQ